MKKKIVLFLMCCLCMSTYAQFYVGGSLGISCVTNKVEGESSTASSYGITPEVGYRINKWVAVGAALGVSYIQPGSGTDDLTSFEFSPYVRTTFARLSAVEFFADAVLSYENVKNHNTDISVDGWGFGLCPGIVVGLTEHWKLQGRTALFQYSKASDEGIEVKQTGFALGNNLTVGVIYQF